MSAVEPSPRSRKLSWKRRLGLFALSFFCSPAVYLYLGFPRRALTVSLGFIALFAAIVFGPVWCFQYAAAFILLMLFMWFAMGLWWMVGTAVILAMLESGRTSVRRRER